MTEFSVGMHDQSEIMTDYEIRKCYLCGKEGANSVDHIPPKNLFLKKYRDTGINLITVPAHIECNLKNSLDDEYFRYSLLIAAFPVSKVAQELWDTKIKKGVHRPLSKGFFKYLLDNLIPVDVETPAGLFIGQAEAAKLDAERIHQVVGRIAKGIYYNKTKMLLPSDQTLKVELMNYRYVDPEMIKTREQLQKAGLFISIEESIFKYCWDFEDNNKGNEWFWFVFFDCVDFRVTIGNS